MSLRLKLAAVPCEGYEDVEMVTSIDPATQPGPKFFLEEWLRDPSMRPKVDRIERAMIDAGVKFKQREV